MRFSKCALFVVAIFLAALEGGCARAIQVHRNAGLDLPKGSVIALVVSKPDLMGAEACVAQVLHQKGFDVRMGLGSRCAKGRSRRGAEPVRAGGQPARKRPGFLCTVELERVGPTLDLRSAQRLKVEVVDLATGGTVMEASGEDGGYTADAVAETLITGLQ